MGTREELRAALDRLSRQPLPAPDLDVLDDPWQIAGENFWWNIDPKEDLAVIPELEWPDDVKRLALTEYEEKFAKYLEPEQYYVMIWPPEGFLADGGDWGWPEAPDCDWHSADERDSSCQRCQAVWAVQSDDARVCYSMAEWEWTVEVQTWQTYRRPDGQVGSYQVVDDDGPDRETWYVGRTKLLPWEIRYDA